MRLHCMTHWEFVNGTIGLHIPRILINHDSLWIYCGIDVFKSCFFSPEFELVKTSWMHSNDISFEARESKLQNYELNKFPKIYGNSTQNCLNCWFYIHGRHCIVSNTHTHTHAKTQTHSMERTGYLLCGWQWIRFNAIRQIHRVHSWNWKEQTHSSFCSSKCVPRTYGVKCLFGLPKLFHIKCNVRLYTHTHMLNAERQRTILGNTYESVCDSMDVM